jgi:hypothetical protein
MMPSTDLLIMHPLVIVKPGDIIETWCPVQMDRTPHAYNPHAKVPLVCLTCHPEKDPRKAGEK